MRSRISTNLKFTITIIFLYFVYLFTILFSRSFADWMLKLLTPIFLLYAIVVLYFVSNIWRENFYNINITVSKLLPDNHYKVFDGISTASRIVYDEFFGPLIRGEVKILEKRYPDIDFSSLNYEDIRRDIITIAAILSIFLGITLFAALLQDFRTENKIADIIKTNHQNIEMTPSLEPSAYLITTTPSNINSRTFTPIPTLTPTSTFTPMPTLTPTSTFTPTPTLTPTSTPTITPTPTRRVVFGQTLGSSEGALIATPTPTLFLSEREKKGLPAIVILEVMVSEDGLQPKLLLANFGYTTSMANWRLYFDQQLICTFGEYIFWSDTVLTLDVSRNLEERTVDDQVILKCKQVKTLSRQVVIKLQDLYGIEVDRYIYKEMQSNLSR